MEKLNKSKRVTVNIPMGSEIHKFLQNNGKVADWVLLNELVKQLPKSKEDRAIIVFDTFIEKMGELYPESKKAFESLRPLIMKQIINKQPLESWYYEELKKL